MKSDTVEPKTDVRNGQQEKTFAQKYAEAHPNTTLGRAFKAQTQKVDTYWKQIGGCRKLHVAEKAPTAGAEPVVNADCSDSD